MSRPDSVYLSDILEAIELILKYIENRTKEEFGQDIMLQDAVTRRFEIIGEAATQISSSFKNANPDVPWKKMKSMRNKLIHEYFGASATTIYLTVISDLPILKAQLQKIV